jgi:hypothetical protein
VGLDTFSGCGENMQALIGRTKDIQFLKRERVRLRSCDIEREKVGFAVVEPALLYPILHYALRLLSSMGSGFI